jgi:hypothetical protein
MKKYLCKKTKSYRNLCVTFINEVVMATNIPANPPDLTGSWVVIPETHGQRPDRTEPSTPPAISFAQGTSEDFPSELRTEAAAQHALFCKIPTPPSTPEPRPALNIAPIVPPQQVSGASASCLDRIFCCCSCWPLTLPPGRLIDT